MSWKFLPREILIQIFGYCVQNEEQSVLFNVIAKVCPQWRAACYDSYLWRSWDGSLKVKKLKELSAKGYLQRTENLILNRISKVSVENFDVIFSGLSGLKCVTLKRTECSLDKLFLGIVKYCANIREVVMSHRKAHLSRELFNFLTVLGSNLVSLHFVQVNTPSNLTNQIWKNCFNLEVFYYIQCTDTAFPIKSFQTGCAKLKTLCLDENVWFSQTNVKTQSYGFPLLEQFAYVGQDTYHINDMILLNVLSNSEKLQLIDIRGCSALTCDALLKLPAHSVEYFYASRSNVCKSKKLGILLAGWKSSLKVVDISRICDNYVNDAVLMLLAPEPVSKLVELNLSGTPITTRVILKILKTCTKLEILHLESCRELKKGQKRVYKGMQELEVLYEKLLKESEVLSDSE